MINFYEIQKLRKCYAKTKLDIDIELHVLNSKSILIKELQNCRFCPKNIVAYAEKCTHMLKMQEANMTYYIYYKNTQDVPYVTKIIRSFRQSLALTSYFGVNKILNVHIIMSPYKRFFPVAKSTLISAEHINGGYTDRNGNNIYILRSEEFSKVILHEILHHYKEVHFTPQEINMLKSIFNIHSDCFLLPNEAVIELWATVMHCLFLSFDYKMYYKSLLKQEIKHSLIQCHKIFDKQTKLSASKWNEYTNAYCYIVFKCILLMGLDKLNADSMTKSEYIVEYLMNNKNIVQNIESAIDWKDRSLKMCKTSDF